MQAMATGRTFVSLGKVALVALLVVPLAAIWLSGRFGEDADREVEPPGSAPAARATLPRTDTVATAAVRPPPAPDSVPIPAPVVTVGPGTVTAPPNVPGAAPAPPATAGSVVGTPTGLPDPNRSEAMPKPTRR